MVHAMMGKPTATVGYQEGDVPPVHDTGVVTNPLAFAKFGLDRQTTTWVEPDWERPVLHLGPGNKHINGTVEFDWPEWDFDRMGNGGPYRFPYEDNEVGGVIATHVLEHLKDPRNLLREVSRILRPGCPFNILVPHGQSLMFLQDLDHKTAFVTETWKTLLSNPYYLKEHDGFRFTVGANFIFGVKESNTALVTQLIKARMNFDPQPRAGTSKMNHELCGHSRQDSVKFACEGLFRTGGIADANTVRGGE